jgi:hypothetical protein
MLVGMTLRPHWRVSLLPAIGPGMLSLSRSLRVFVVVEACLQHAKGRRSPCGLLFLRQPSARCAAKTI